MLDVQPVMERTAFLEGNLEGIWCYNIATVLNNVGGGGILDKDLTVCYVWASSVECGQKAWMLESFFMFWSTNWNQNSLVC